MGWREDGEPRLRSPPRSGQTQIAAAVDQVGDPCAQPGLEPCACPEARRRAVAGSLTRAGRDYLAQRPREGRTFSCSDPAWDGGMPPRGSWRRPGGPQPRRPAPLRRDRVSPAPIGAGYDDSCGEHRRHVGGRLSYLCLPHQTVVHWQCAEIGRVDDQAAAMVLGGGPRDATVRWMRPGGARHAPGRGGGLAFKAVGWGGVGCRGVAHQRRGVLRTKPEQYCGTLSSSGAVTSRAARPPRSFRDGVCPHGRRSRGRAGGRMGQLPRPWLGSAGAADCTVAPLLRCQGHCLHCRLRPLRPP